MSTCYEIEDLFRTIVSMNSIRSMQSIFRLRQDKRLGYMIDAPSLNRRKAPAKSNYQIFYGPSLFLAKSHGCRSNNNIIVVKHI